MINCPYYSREPGNKHNGICALGWFGGKPFLGECLHKCLPAGKNTQAAYDAVQVEYERTHPEPFRGVSGCCDRADQV
jgi:hypothetical protein